MTIGSVRLKRDFFEIYLKEAAQHVAALRAECTTLAQAPPGEEVSHEFLRAAHTLASSSRTAGFTAIADLAGALEQWMPFAAAAAERADAKTVQEAIAGLREMVEAVAR